MSNEQIVGMYVSALCTANVEDRAVLPFLVRRPLLLFVFNLISNSYVMLVFRPTFLWPILAVKHVYLLRVC